MKNIVATLLFILPVLTHAQTDTRHQLLWYKGRLVKPHVLITPQGDSVFFDSKKNQLKVVSKSGKGKAFDGMLTELSKTATRSEALLKQMAGVLPRPVYLEMVKSVKEAYQEVETDWKPLMSNTIALPIEDLGLKSQPVTGKGGGGLEPDLRRIIEEKLQILRDWKEKHKDDNLSILPVPPRYDFSYCFPCDSVARTRYEKEENRFIAEMMAADTAVYNLALNLASNLQKVGLYEMFKKETDEAVEFFMYIIIRGVKRAQYLSDKYLSDPYRVKPVLAFIMGIDRWMQIMGGYNTYQVPQLEYIDKAMRTLDNFIHQAFEEKNYAIGLNMNFILKFEREKQILGSLSGTAHPLFLEFLKFNQFKLNSNVSVKLGDERGYVAGHLRGDNWFHAIPNDSTCRLKWIMAGPPNRNAQYKLLQAEASASKYVGTMNWQSQPPIMKMDFCRPEGVEEEDSILAGTFHPEGYREPWKLPDPYGVIQVENLSGTFMACFLDVERIKQEVEQLNQTKIDQLKKEMMQKYAKMTTTDMTKAGLESQRDMEKLNQEIREMLMKNNPGKYLFTPVLNNKNALILKERLNGQEIFPENIAIIYAWFHLTLEHDPNGPHRLSINN